KFIYFWEWTHRLLARLVGMAFALPLAWFWVRQQIPKGYKPRLLALLALGGLQGAVGWWMGSSGLTQDVRVSYFRLAAHRRVAVLIAMGRKLKARRQRPPSIAVHSAFGLQLILGIATVMSGVALWLAVAHQLTGALLVAATTWGAHALGRQRPWMERP